MEEVGKRVTKYVIEYLPGVYCLFDHGKKPWHQDKYGPCWGIQYATQFPLLHQAKLALRNVSGGKIIAVEYEIKHVKKADV